MKYFLLLVALVLQGCPHGPGRELLVSDSQQTPRPWTTLVDQCTRTEDTVTCPQEEFRCAMSSAIDLWSQAEKCAAELIEARGLVELDRELLASRAQTAEHDLEVVRASRWMWIAIVGASCLIAGAGIGYGLAH